MTENNNLPLALTRFIGREKEIAAIKHSLESTRLITLTGSGGCGKTRLALQVARDLPGFQNLEGLEFPDCVWLIELSALADPTLVPQTIASVFDLRAGGNRAPMDLLKNFLREKNLLLVLDNCEHLIDACAQFAETILTHCPDVKILATSREALNIAGEITFRVPSLALPDLRGQPQGLPLHDLAQFEAIRLFIERARAAQSEFELTDANKLFIAQICARLDGMPLAIELAAARVKTMTVEEIAARLDDRFHLLTTGSRTAPTRQQTLRAAMEWSYALLSDAERIVLNRVSVFAGGWTLDAAEFVCAEEKNSPALPRSPAPQLDVLARLADKSLVIVETRDGATRYRMLETIRQYAREKLSDARQVEIMRARHCDFFVALAETAEPQLKGPAAKEWMDGLEREYDNIRAVFEYALANDVKVAVRLTLALVMFWVRRNYLIEERKMLAQLLARPEITAEPALYVKILNSAGYLDMIIQDFVSARSLYLQGLDIAKQLEDIGEIARALHGLGRTHDLMGDFEAARPLLEEGLMLYRVIGDAWGEAHALFLLGTNVWLLGDAPRGQTLLEESLQRFRAIGDITDSAFPLYVLGNIARRQGDYDRAAIFYTECIAICRQQDNRIDIGHSTMAMGLNVLEQGDYRRAVEFLTESIEHFHRRGKPKSLVSSLLGLAGVINAVGKPAAVAHILGALEGLPEAKTTHGFRNSAANDLRTRLERETRHALSAETFIQSWQAGHALDLDKAIAFALAEIKILDARDSTKEKFAGLTAREREVAALIAQGKTNREIADALVLSERTVESYVGNMLNKLGFNTRAQIAAWAVEKGVFRRDEKSVR
ncbi:MAG: tetratricopeptide repeat protein [Chloroflexi bacterium]|nr:tetratricopeptide repeat protein [Chloroflexota bacterium]